MAHRTRGHRSGTYDITEVLDVDEDHLTITVRHTGAFQPYTFSLGVPGTQAARQMLRAIAASITVSTTADAGSGWESVATLMYSVTYCRAVLEQLTAAGLDCFADDRVDIPLLRSLYEPLNESSKRNAVHLLARILQAEHPNGRPLAYALKNTRFPVEDSNTVTYDEPVADAIETAARGVWTDQYTLTRSVFERLGHDVRTGRGRGWLHTSAAEIIDWAQRTHPDWTDPNARQPLDGVFEHEMAWALTHPEQFGMRQGRQQSLAISRPSLRSIGEALYPGRATLTAALILHCLGENSGYNYAVLLGKSADSLIRIGQNTALEHSVKARNHSQDTRVTHTGSIHTPGGIIDTLAGLTRFSRHYRRGLLIDGRPAPVVDRLYVAHFANPAQSRVMSNADLHAGWRNSVFDAHWPGTPAAPHDRPIGDGRRRRGRDDDTNDQQLVRDDVPLHFRALRLVAQARAMKEGLRADVHGHSERTKVHYLAHVLPKHVFNTHAVAAQNAFHDDTIAEFTVVAPGVDDPVAAELAAVPADEAMDIEVGVCANGGNDPDDRTRPCSLGINACFTCPHGYRTVDHIPGLLAAVELTHVIERNNTEEWTTGDAPLLRHYAQACLDAFPPLVVANVERTVDLEPHLHTVTGMYLELRHG